jgi:hypothetical protein
MMMTEIKGVWCDKLIIVVEVSHIESTRKAYRLHNDTWCDNMATTLEALQFVVLLKDKTSLVREKRCHIDSFFIFDFCIRDLHPSSSANAIYGRHSLL